jgi:hypothetical protein
MLQPNGKTFHLQLSMLELQWLEGIDRPFTTKNTLLSTRTNIGGKTNLLLQYSCCISLLKTKNNLGKQTTSWKMHACRACSNDEKNMTKCNLHQEKSKLWNWGQHQTKSLFSLYSLDPTSRFLRYNDETCTCLTCLLLFSLQIDKARNLVSFS